MECLDVRVKKSRAKKLLGVTSYEVWRSHLKAVGLSEQTQWFSLDDLNALLALQLYLKARLGVHSKEGFSVLFQKGGLPEIKKVLFSFNLDFSRQKESLMERVEAQFFY